jgi:hypothetical protein
VKKTEIEDAVGEAMASRHWELKSLCRLPKAYVREIPVTPAYVPGVIRRSESVYLITGYVGIIHQKFEKIYVERAIATGSDLKRQSSFCLGLDIANFDVLRGLRYIKYENWQREVTEFCSALAQLLEQMPHDEAALKIVLQRHEVVGMALEKFVPYGQNEKFAALEQFLNAATSADELSRN